MKSNELEKQVRDHIVGHLRQQFKEQKVPTELAAGMPGYFRQLNIDCIVNPVALRIATEAERNHVDDRDEQFFRDSIEERLPKIYQAAKYLGNKILTDFLSSGVRSCEPSDVTRAFDDYFAKSKDRSVPRKHASKVVNRVKVLNRHASADRCWRV
jgi:hypothetical protein